MMTSRRPLVEVVALAASALMARPVRSALLGVGSFLGVAIIVGAFGLLESTQGKVRAALEELGVNLVTVQVVVDGQRLPSQAVQRAQAIPTVTGVVGIAKVSDVTVSRHPPGLALPPTAPAANEVLAVTDDAYRVLGLQLAWGRRLGAADEAGALPVAVVGAQVARNLALEEGLLQTVYLGSTPFLVVGVLEPTTLFAELNFALLVPAASAQQTLGAPAAPTRLAVAVESGTAPATAAVIPDAITYGESLELEVAFPASLVVAQVQVDAALASAILAVGVLTMLVGALGIGNVMMISVLERRREIGVRRAIGHPRRMIAGSFLAEAAIVGVIGALTGAASAAALVVTVSAVAGWTPVLHPSLVLIAAGLGVVMSVAASIIPAWRASAIEPASALRSD